MHSRANELPKSSETASRRQPDETPLDPYHGIELASVPIAEEAPPSSAPP